MGNGSTSAHAPIRTWSRNSDWIDPRYRALVALAADIRGGHSHGYSAMLLDGPRLAPLSKSPAKQLVILVHGYGSDGDDLISLAPSWRPLLPDAAFVAPNAPLPMSGGGYQWWPLVSLTNAELAAGVIAAAPALDRFIDQELARTGLAEKDLLLVGFSQGTMMSLHVGPRRKAAVAGIIGYSGMLIAPDLLQAEAQSRPPILLIHGAADSVVPVRALSNAAQALQLMDFPVETHVSPGLDHGIDPAGLALGGAFAQRVLSVG